MPRKLCQSSVRPKEADVQRLFQWQKFLGRKEASFQQSNLESNGAVSLGENCITSVAYSVSPKQSQTNLCWPRKRERELQEAIHSEYLYFMELWAILKSVLSVPNERRGFAELGSKKWTLKAGLGPSSVLHMSQCGSMVSVGWRWGQPSSRPPLAMEAHLGNLAQTL